MKYIIALIISFTCLFGNAQSSFSEKVDSVYAIAQHYYQLGAYSFAIKSQQELVTLLENSEYTDAYINQLSMLGSMYDANNDVSNAISTHSKVINLIVGNYGEAEFLSTPYTNLILAYIKNGQYDSAKATYKKFGRMYSSLDYIENAEGYLYLAANIREKLQMKYVYSEAELGIAKSEITVAKDYFGDDSPTYGKVAAYIGNLFVFLGDFDEGISYLKKSVEAYKQNQSGYKEEYIKALNNLADAYISLENYPEAKKIIDDVLPITINYYGDDAPENALAFMQMSRIYYGIGDYAQAEEYGLHALALTETLGNREGEEYIQYLSNLGGLYAHLGHIKKALYYYTLANEVTQDYEGHEPTKAYGLAFTQLELASLFMDVGFYDKAKEKILSSIKLLDDNWGKENPHSPRGYMALSQLYYETQQPDSALWCLQKVNAVYKKIYSPTQFNYTQVYDNMRSIYYLQGKYDSAAIMAEKSLDLSEKTVGKNHYGYRQTLLQATETFVKINHPKASKYVQQLITVDREELHNKLTFLSGDELLSYIRSQTYNSHHLLAYYTSKNPQQFSGELFNNLLMLKGASLRYSNTISSRLKNTNDTAVQNLYKKLVGLRSLLAKEYTKPKSNSNTFVWEVEADELEKLLIKKSADFRDVDALFTANWKQIQQQLKPNEVAVEFVRYDMWFVKDEDSVKYGALILRPQDKQPVYVPLFNEGKLQNILSSVAPKQMFATRSSELLSEVQIDPSAYGDSLYRLIWKPLEKYLGNSKTAYLSADGLLHQVAFNALPTSDSTLLIDKYRLVQLLSLKDIGQQENKPAPLKNAVLFGGIDYSADETATKDSALSLLPEDRGMAAGFNYLQGTLTETQQIQHLLQTIKANALLYTAKDATEEQFKQLSGNAPQVLHLATHGFFIQEAKEAKKSGSFGENENAFTLANNPLMRGGLLLAGGNRAWKGLSTPKGKEDGVLTAYEVAGLDLSNTQLVVLSACQTGLGETGGTEGVFGLQRAFKMAGAKTLLMSLWSVPDKETKELMELFYAQYVQTGNVRASFEAAQKAMRAKYAPYYWAAFVLVE